MLRLLIIITGLILLPATTLAQDYAASASRHLLFSYFKGNGEDGLHLAYSQDGLSWRALNGDRPFVTPIAGQDKLMRDPSIVFGPDSLFHMVWTVSWNEKGIGHASSKDVIHWSKQKYIPVMEHEELARNCWAPELFYDDASAEYLIFWATTMPGRFPETDGQDASEGRPGWNHRIYYVKTRDFERFSETKLFYDHGFNVIDSFIFKEGDQFVMLLKDETNKPFTPQKNIRLAFSNRAEGPYSKPTEPITGDYWAEGATAIKIGQEWYVYF
ncbi:MAG TPA: glycoside hydrolase family 43 protein, partial [bacterium]